MQKKPIEKICVFIFKKTMRGYEMLLLKRPEKHGSIWQPVTGHMEKNEDTISAAKREVKEETGIDEISRIIDPEYSYEFISTFKKHYKEYVFGFEVSPNIEEVLLSDEHVSYSWLNVETSKEMIYWPEEKKALDKVQEKGGF